MAMGRCNTLSQVSVQNQFGGLDDHQPAFRLAESFVLEGLRVARCGVAILARTVFLESWGRYREIFSRNPPTKFAQLVERVPMVKGRLDAKASLAASKPCQGRELRLC